MSERIKPLAAPKIALAAPGAATGIFSGGFTPSWECSLLRITVRLTTASVLQYTITPTGGSKITCKLNEGVALVAGCAYCFEVPIRKSDGAAPPVLNVFNIEIETNGTVDYLAVDEVEG